MISTILAVALSATAGAATPSVSVDAKQEAAALATMSEGVGAPVKSGRHVLLETSKGPVVLALFDQDSPETAENFAKLVKKGFYDGTKFHRVIEGFVAQGGDPKGTGEGGPGYEIKFEKNRLKHVTGAVGMARSQELDSAGSQFFIDFQPLPNLDQKFDADGKPIGGYVVFAQVVTGMDVVNKLTRTMGRKSMAPFSGVEADKVVKATLLD